MLDKVKLTKENISIEIKSFQTQINPSHRLFYIHAQKGSLFTLTRAKVQNLSYQNLLKNTIPFPSL